jgi:putative FmdB family regulatory protein
MPIYEYECQDCGEDFEIFVLSVSKADEVECPKCHSRNIKRKISLFGWAGSKGSSSTVGSSCSTSTVG